MGKLRHIALSVRDLEEAAKCYEDAFGMQRVRQSDVAVMMSDGVVSLALLHLQSNDNAPDERGSDFIGIHHLGFLVDDMDEACATIENGDPAAVTLSTGERIAPGESVEVCGGEDIEVRRIRVNDGEFSGGWLIVDPAR